MKSPLNGPSLSSQTGLQQFGKENWTKIAAVIAAKVWGSLEYIWTAYVHQKACDTVYLNPFTEVLCLIEVFKAFSAYILCRLGATRMLVGKLREV